MKTKRFFFKTMLLVFLATTSLLTAMANDTDTIRFTWEATSNGTKTFYLRVPDGKQYTVDWGNDSIETRVGIEIGHYQSITSPAYTAGIYTVTVTGSMTTFLDFYLNGPVTTLHLYNCTALEHLICTDNELISLNASGCTALESLECSDNKLTSLNVSGCTALRQMYCDNNELTSLDVSSCIALKLLNCSQNQLSSLDLSQNTVLAVFDCFYNQLSSLDLSQNTVLRSFGCSYNQLSSLDLSNNINLKTLGCFDNHIPLCNLYAISKKMLNVILLGTQRLLPRVITVGDTIDFSKQVAFGNPDTATLFVVEKDSLPALLNVDYTISNGVITFNKTGNYTVTMTNEAIVSRSDYPAKVIATINVSGVGTIENTLPEINIYPNPTFGQLTIGNGELTVGKIMIYDIMGKKQNVECRMQNEIDISHLSTGVYFLRVETEKRTITKKIIKK